MRNALVSSGAIIAAIYAMPAFSQEALRLAPDTPTKVDNVEAVLTVVGLEDVFSGATHR